MIQHCHICDKIIHGMTQEDFKFCPHCKATQQRYPTQIASIRDSETQEDPDEEIRRLKKEVNEWKRLYEEAMRILETATK